MLSCTSVYSITPNAVEKHFSHSSSSSSIANREVLPCWMIPYSWLCLGVSQRRNGTVTLAQWEPGQGIPAPSSVCSMRNGNAEGRDIGCFGRNKTSLKFWIDFSRDSLQHFRRSSRSSENAVRHVLSSVLNSNLVFIFVDPYNPWTVAESTKSLRAPCSKRFGFTMALEIFLWRVCDIGWNFIRPALENQFTKGRSRKILVNH